MELKWFQVEILESLKEQPARTQRELAGRFQTDLTSIRRALRPLVENGLVIRKSIGYVLTSKGEELVEKYQRGLIEQFIGSLSLDKPIESFKLLEQRFSEPPMILLQQSEQYQSNIANILLYMAQIWQGIWDSIAKIAESYIRPLIEALRKEGLIYETIKRFYEALKQLDEALKQLDEAERRALKRAGWFYFPSMENIPIGLLGLLHKALQKFPENPKAIDEVFCEYFSADNCTRLKQMVAQWRKNPLFQSRMTIIEDALEAHIAGKYTLSIPTLLPLIEGVAREYALMNGILTAIQTPKGEKLPKLKPKDFRELIRKLHYRRKPLCGISAYRDDRLFENFLVEILWQDTSKLRDPLIANRHIVLHNLRNDYADEVFSLKLFCVLDRLALLTDIFWEDDEESAETVKESSD